MRSLPARRLAAGALCAALLTGIAGSAAMAADPVREDHPVAPQLRQPAADALRAQAGKVRGSADVLTPVTELLNTIAKADKGQLTAAQARQAGEAAKRAVAEAVGRTPAGSAAGSPASAAVTGQRAADPVSDALAALDKAIDDLVQAVTNGVGDVQAVVTDLLTQVAGLVTGLLTAVDAPADSASAAPADSASAAPADSSATPSPTATSSASASSSEPVTSAVTLPAISLPSSLLSPAS
ncbi:hypothetical protein [Streptomyces sp. BBFR109]|uniref:hypothetical protein n=1 Tax=Streptomyces sp. BBFR109 TaxID=3448172 RepID=UPI003F757479